jgi:WD40 repeat protein
MYIHTVEIGKLVHKVYLGSQCVKLITKLKNKYFPPATPILNKIFTHCGKYCIGIQGQSIIAIDKTTKQSYTIGGNEFKRGCVNGSKHETRLSDPQGLALMSDGKTLFISDTFNHCIRVLNLKTMKMTHFAGDARLSGFITGSKDISQLSYPTDIKLSPDENTLFVCNDKTTIRAIDIKSGEISIFAGKDKRTGTCDGFRTDAEFVNIKSLQFLTSGKMMAITDKHTERLLCLDCGIVSSIVSPWLKRRYNLALLQIGKVVTIGFDSNESCKHEFQKTHNNPLNSTTFKQCLIQSQIKKYSTFI